MISALLDIDTTGARLLDLRRHDLRHTLGSWQAATASLVVIGKSLDHKNMASTQIYSRLDIDPVRDAMQTATSAIFAAGGLLTVRALTRQFHAVGRHTITSPLISVIPKIPPDGRSHANCGKYSATNSSTSDACKMSRSIFIVSRLGCAAIQRLNSANALGEMVFMRAM